MPGPGMELIGEEEIQEVLAVLKSGYLYRYDVAPGETNFQGKVMQVEAYVAQMSQVQYAVAVNSGTSALLTAMVGLGIGGVSCQLGRDLRHLGRVRLGVGVADFAFVIN